jgi:hypothetical protein
MDCGCVISPVPQSEGPGAPTGVGWFRGRALGFVVSRPLRKVREKNGARRVVAELAPAGVFVVYPVPKSEGPGAPSRGRAKGLP